MDSFEKRLIIMAAAFIFVLWCSLGLAKWWIMQPIEQYRSALSPTEESK